MLAILRWYLMFYTYIVVVVPYKLCLLFCSETLLYFSYYFVVILYILCLLLCGGTLFIMICCGGTLFIMHSILRCHPYIFCLLFCGGTLCIMLAILRHPYCLSIRPKALTTCWWELNCVLNKVLRLLALVREVGTNGVWSASKNWIPRL